MAIKLTTAKIEKLKGGITRDAEVRGLFVDVGITGASYKIQGTLYQGDKPKSVRMTLGRTTDYGLEEAREWAREHLRLIRMGKDPRTHQPKSEWTVAAMYDGYAASLEKRGKSDGHRSGMIGNRDRYLKTWADMPMDNITTEMADTMHSGIGERYGRTAANNTFRQFRAAFNWALKRRGLRGQMPNPAEGIDFFPDNKGENNAIPLKKLKWWFREVQKLEDPTRRNFHKLLLLSGMRPRSLTETCVEWINLEDRFISYPKLKAGRPFDLPLSKTMAEIVREQMQFSTEWLFPAASASGHLATWREKTLHPYCGKAMRQSYVSYVNTLPIDPVHRHALTDHTVPGIQGTYASDKILFPKLLEAQDMVSRYVIDMVNK